MLRYILILPTSENLCNFDISIWHLLAIDRNTDRRHAETGLHQATMSTAEIQQMIDDAS